MKKIAACKSHKTEFGCNEFMTIEAMNVNLKKTLVKGNLNDIYKFNIKGNNQKYITFKVNIIDNIISKIDPNAFHRLFSIVRHSATKLVSLTRKRI